jgi:hypothetical protein
LPLALAVWVTLESPKGQTRGNAGMNSAQAATGTSRKDGHVQREREREEIQRRRMMNLESSVAVVKKQFLPKNLFANLEIF